MKPQDLDTRRKRLLFRSKRCGMHENDILIGGFCTARIAELDAARLVELEALLDQIDPDIFQWVTRRAPTPPAFETSLMKMIRNFNKIE